MTLHTLYGSGVPDFTASVDTNNYNLGTYFTSDVNGFVNAVRFYKGNPSDVGTHTGSLWEQGTGAKLGEVVFTGETSSGWQTMNFAAPIAITAGVTYVVALVYPMGYYIKKDFVYSGAVDYTPLHVPADGGKYVVTASVTMPVNSFNGASYYVDLVFDDGVAGGSNPISGASAIAFAASGAPTKQVNLGASIPMSFSASGAPILTRNILGSTLINFGVVGALTVFDPTAVIGNAEGISIPLDIRGIRVPYDERGIYIS